MRIAMAAIALVAVSGAGCTSGSGPAPSDGRLAASYTTMSAGQFDTLVNSMLWSDSGATKPRCTDSTCTAHVQVRIEAGVNSYTIDSLNGGVLGTIVARVQNLGGDTTYMYHFKPGPYRYYFLVKSDAAGPRWVLLEKHDGSVPDSVGAGRFTGCWDHLAATEAKADFRDCERRISGALKHLPIPSFAPRAAGHPALRALRQGYSEAGAWIGCKYGCCPMTSTASSS